MKQRKKVGNAQQVLLCDTFKFAEDKLVARNAFLLLLFLVFGFLPLPLSVCRFVSLGLWSETNSEQECGTVHNTVHLTWDCRNCNFASKPLKITHNYTFPLFFFWAQDPFPPKLTSCAWQDATRNNQLKRQFWLVFNQNNFNRRKRGACFRANLHIFR